MAGFFSLLSANTAVELANNIGTIVSFIRLLRKLNMIFINLSLVAFYTQYDNLTLVYRCINVLIQ